MPRVLLLLSCSIVSDSLLPHGLYHSRPSCPSTSSEDCSNSCPLSRSCHPIISSPVITFYSCLQAFPASGSFLMSKLFSSGGQNIGASASAAVPPMNIQDWFPLRLTGWIYLQSKGLSKVFSNVVSLFHSVVSFCSSLVAQRLKHLPGMRETRVQSLGQEDPLEKEMATHSSTLAWRIPWREEAGRLQSTGVQRVGHNWATSLMLFHVQF